MSSCGCEMTNSEQTCVMHVSPKLSQLTLCGLICCLKPFQVCSMAYNNKWKKMALCECRKISPNVSMQAV